MNQIHSISLTQFIKPVSSSQKDLSPICAVLNNCRIIWTTHPNKLQVLSPAVGFIIPGFCFIDASNLQNIFAFAVSLLGTKPGCWLPKLGCEASSGRLCNCAKGDLRSRSILNEVLSIYDTILGCQTLTAAQNFFICIQKPLQ